MKITDEHFSRTLRQLIIGLLLLTLSVSFFGCTSNPVFLPPTADKSTSRFLPTPAGTPLARIVRGLTANHSQQTGVYPITSAQDALAVRLTAIRAASRSIDIQYFIFRRDETALLLTRELMAAAERGVRVRFLLDDFTTRSADQVLLQMSRHKNVQLRLFNPFRRNSPRYVELMTDFARLHRRMHNKSLTVDNSVTFIGGRNISNKYFGLDKESTFGDVDVLTIGAVVPEISRQFDTYWNSDYAFPVQQVVKPTASTKDLYKFKQLLDGNAKQLEGSDYGHSLSLSPVMRALQYNDKLWYWGHTRMLLDPLEKMRLSPAQIDQTMETEAIQEITRATERMIIISPYILPGKRYAKALIDAAERGVEINILTNSLSSTDVPPVYGAYRKYRKPLLQAGIKIYEMPSNLRYKLDNWEVGSKSLLHAKLFSIDRRFVYVGSFNLDARSLYWNTELGLLIDSPRLADQINTNFANNIRANSYALILENGKIFWQRSDGKRFNRDPDASIWQRIGSHFTSWLPLEHLL